MSFPPYKLIQCLGQGSFGRVFEAISENSGQRVALKMYVYDYSQMPAGDIFKEHAIGSLGGHGILTVNRVLLVKARDITNEFFLNLGIVHSNYLVLVEMELATFTLSDVIRSNLEVPLSIRVSWIKSLALAMSRLHSRGIVHGDVKPDNVLIFCHDDKKTTICVDSKKPLNEKVLDCKSCEKVVSLKQLKNATIKWGDTGGALLNDTSSQVELHGSPYYIAPEILCPRTKESAPKPDRDPFAIASDVWSFALLCVELIYSSACPLGRLTLDSKARLKSITDILGPAPSYVCPQIKKPQVTKTIWNWLPGFHYAADKLKSHPEDVDEHEREHEHEHEHEHEDEHKYEHENEHEHELEFEHKREHERDEKFYKGACDDVKIKSPYFSVVAENGQEKVRRLTGLVTAQIRGLHDVDIKDEGIQSILRFISGGLAWRPSQRLEAFKHYVHRIPSFAPELQLNPTLWERVSFTEKAMLWDWVDETLRNVIEKFIPKASARDIMEYASSHLFCRKRTIEMSIPNVYRDMLKVPILLAVCLVYASLATLRDVPDVAFYRTQTWVDLAKQLFDEYSPNTECDVDDILNILSIFFETSILDYRV